MDQGVWVELTFTGDVSVATAEKLVERANGYAARFGLRLGTGAVHPGGERAWPGSALMLDVAIRELAGERGIGVAAVRAELMERARGLISSGT
jgi:hypothetical protein